MKKVWIVLFFLCVFLLLLLSLSMNWVVANFGAVGLDEIIFHLNMPMKGANSYISSYLYKALMPAAGIIVEIIIAIKLAKVFFNMNPDLKEKGKKSFSSFIQHRDIFSVLILFIWLSVALLCAQNWFGIFDYIRNVGQQSSFFEQEYVDPSSVAVSFPDEKRNLIYIIVESAETSSQDIENGGLMPVNYIPEMTEIAKRSISFSQSDLIEGAAVPPMCGWTMAGMLAETAGIPLKLYRIHDDKVDNSMGLYESFMPGVIGIGDILENEGYHNVFMCGSDIEFGGRKRYLTEHGNYELLDYFEAVREMRIPSSYYEWWGFEDQKLYEWVKEELSKLSQNEQPFNLTMLTADTHSQDGYICSLCDKEYSAQYANVWRCASRQVDGFVKWCQNQPFYDNTTIVIAGDHCSMDQDFYGRNTIDRYEGGSNRKVYNAFVNSPINPEKENYRLFTTMDLFPSTLAAMGCSIEGEHLGLGVNLFSGEKTLAEKYGYDYMFEEMRKRSAFYNKELLYP